MKVSHISIFAALCLFTSSCMTEDAAIIGETFREIPRVSGKVTDEGGKPLEHIKVTFDWGTGTDASVVYTSSEGIYSTELIENWSDGGGMTLTVTLDDIDGNDNGGLYSSWSEKVMIYKEEFKESPVMLTLDFLLTHATASESIPQV